MKIEAVTVCVGCSQTLKKIIDNKINFNRWVIVTIDCDFDTKRLCEKENLEFITSNRSGLPKYFRKGCLINDGLKTLDKNRKNQSWLLQIDCDILLPPLFKKSVSSLMLNKECLYGCKRFSKIPSNTSKDLLKISHTRESVAIHRKRILGYFQLFHSSKINIYPENSNNCSDDDIEFLNNWDKNKQCFLPFQVTHFGIPFDEERWKGQTSQIKDLLPKTRHL